jgi:hypothetical protein
MWRRWKRRNKRREGEGGWKGKGEEKGMRRSRGGRKRGDREHTKKRRRGGAEGKRRNK